VTQKSTHGKTYHKRPSRMYLNTKRLRGECGSNSTSFTAINHVQWHRDVDEQGKWTGKYLCSKCYARRYRKKRDQEVALMRKKFIAERNAKLANVEKEDRVDTECVVI
jgi:hypothetical protein